MKAAGYGGRPTSENWAGFDSPSLTHSAWIIDSKGKDVGHCRAMIAAGNQEVGIALGGHGLQNFGTPRKGGLVIGTVIYADRNGDGRYTAGEGISGVTVAAGTVSAVSDDTGYVRLDLPAGATGIVSASKGSTAFETPIVATNGTMHWEVLANDPHRRGIERMLRSTERLTDKPERMRQAAIALALAADQAFLNHDLGGTRLGHSRLRTDRDRECPRNDR